MPYLLNLVYLLLLALLAPWIVFQAVRKGKYRQGYAEKFLGNVPLRAGRRRCVWLHAVSVGEVNLLRPIVEAIQQRWPHWDCVVSTTTKTGHALALTRYPNLTVFYCPLDFSWAVRRAMRRIRPDLLVLAELELWPNLVLAARASGAKVAIVNGRLSDGSYRGYRRLGPLVGWLLRRLDLVAAQNPTYADRFVSLGALPQSVEASGSVKFDGAETDRNNPATRRLARLADFDPSDTVFLAGSTQHPEEELALAAFQELAPRHPGLRLVLVPRHPERFEEVAAMLAAREVPFVRRSQLDRVGGVPDCRVLLVDVVGELGAWWGTAGIAFVGGSLSRRGGQNMIEPAAYGAAVCFGPETRNFRDIVSALLGADAAVVVRDGPALTRFVGLCLNEPEFAQSLGHRAQRLVKSQVGATARTLEMLETLMQIEPATSARHAA